MLDDNDIIKLMNAFENSLDSKLDKKFKEQEIVLDLKLEKKGLVWAEKTVKDILKGMGFDVEKQLEVQSDLIFLHWLRLLCTNMVSKTIMLVGGVWGLSAVIEYAKSKGINIK
jgi:hypothetical protein